MNNKKTISYRIYLSTKTDSNWPTVEVARPFEFDSLPDQDHFVRWIGQKKSIEVEAVE